MNSFDALIVGRGLAGNTLALTLLEQGATIKVVDIPKQTSSSRLAAGLFNPFTGKRTTKTWLAEELFPFLHAFYKRIEKKTGGSFLHEMPIYRPFLSIADYNDWSSKIIAEDFSAFVNDLPDHTKYSSWIYNPMGGLECKQSGYLDTVSYLDAARKELMKHECLIEETFHYQDLTVNADEVKWRGNCFRFVIFCEGVSAMNNPYFPNLAHGMTPNKGELLTLEIPNFSLTEIVSKGVFLVKKSDNTFQLGSTYKWAFEHEEPELSGVEEITTKFKKWFKGDFHIKKVVAGIRPATKDRKPLIGCLNENPRVFMFNGLGAKGVSLAPYWAEHLSDFLLKKKDLNPEVDIRRFYVN
jgi:glycine/D-amino acid oxidase-like deaminating enzyme